MDSVYIVYEEICYKRREDRSAWTDPLNWLVPFQATSMSWELRGINCGAQVEHVRSVHLLHIQISPRRCPGVTVNGSRLCRGANVRSIPELSMFIWILTSRVVRSSARMPSNSQSSNSVPQFWYGDRGFKMLGNSYTN